jgi:site-specific recombinase XerD
MGAKFILKDKKSYTPKLIYLYYFINYKQYKYSTGIKVSPVAWDDKRGRVKERQEIPLAKDYNMKLLEMERAAERIVYRKSNEGEELTNELFRNEMDIALGRVRNPIVKPGFITLFQERFEELKQRDGFEKVKSRQSTINRIKEFYPNWEKLQFEDIDFGFYEKFQEYLIYDQEYSINYTGTMIRNLKAFMSYCYDRGMHTNTDFRKFKKVWEDVDNIYLTDEELKKLRAVQVDTFDRRVLDCFLIQCYTGLRYIDLATLSNADISGGCIKKRTSKTDIEIVVPIHSYIAAITFRNNGFPKAPANSIMNKQIKLIAKAAGLTRNVKIKKTIKGQKTFKEFECWQLIGTHTGRRTALTNMYLRGIDLLSITKISGHTTVKQLQAYLKVDALESATSLVKHAFFKE